MDIIKENPEIRVFLEKAVENYVLAIKQYKTHNSVHDCYQMYEKLKNHVSNIVSLEIDKCRIELFDNFRSPECESNL